MRPSLYPRGASMRALFLPWTLFNQCCHDNIDVLGIGQGWKQAMAEQRFASVGGLRTHYLQAGSGPALFMLHGQLPGSSAEVEFGGNIDHFAAAGYTVYAPDLAGFGLTDNPQDFSIAARIAHVEAFIALTGMAPRSEAAEKQAKAIHSYRPSLEAARALLSCVLVSHKPSDALVQLFYQMSTGKNEEAERQRRAAGRPRAIHGELSELRASSLVLWGNDDVSVPGERGLLLFSGLPFAEFHMLHRCGHWPQHDQPERTHRLVGDFLRAA
jgi:pimeloyl-ACP methyl ester carboxylesterase